MKRTYKLNLVVLFSASVIALLLEFAFSQSEILTMVLRGFVWVNIWLLFLISGSYMSFRRRIFNVRSLYVPWLARLILSLKFLTIITLLAYVSTLTLYETIYVVLGLVIGLSLIFCINIYSASRCFISLKGL